ncbi:MAG: hypothetical protein U0W40_07105 [Acidimicrobiia bacterium]
MAPRRLGVALAVVLGLDLVVLVVSGVFLAFRYLPDAASPSDTVGVARTAHAVSAWVAVVGVVAAVVVLVAARADVRRRALFWCGAVLVVGSVGYGLVTGAGLAWDQLALWAVTTGNHVPRGVLALPDTVKFVLVGSDELSRGDFTTAAWIHVLVLPLVFLCAAAMVWWSTRRSAPVSLDQEAVAANA